MVAVGYGAATNAACSGLIDAAWNVASVSSKGVCLTLVLSRDRDQQVVITVPPSTKATQIVVMLVDTRDGTARLGFSAPKNCPVNRREVQDAIDRGESRNGDAR